MRASRTTTMVISLVATVALASGCGGSGGETTTGAGDTTSGNADAPDTGGGSDPDGGADLPAGCHEAPATTALGMPGGGEIVCDDPGGADAAGDTTIPPQTTAPIPDGEGVARGTLGGSPCSQTRTDEPCIEIYELLSGEVTFDPLDGQGDPRTVEVGAGDDPTSAGRFEVSLEPGRWSLHGSPDTADRTCGAVEITVDAGAVTETSILCQAP